MNEASLHSPKSQANEKGAKSDIGNIFAEVVAIAWNRMDLASTKAVRAVCQSGRQLHDRMVTELSVELGASDGDLEPTPAELSHFAASMFARGAQPKVVKIYLVGDEELALHEQQMLAILGACSDSSVQDIKLCGDVHVTRAIASAVGSIKPSSLTLSYDEQPPDGWPRDAHNYAVIELLQKSLPSIKSLQVIQASHWPASTLHSLCLGTGLQELRLESFVPRYSTSTAEEIQSYLQVIAGLSQLKTLEFRPGVRVRAAVEEMYYPSLPEACTLDLGCLSTLSSLTSLTLDLEQCRHWYNTAEQTHVGAAGVGPYWVAIWDRQRAGLMDALQRMPGLMQLDLGRMQLDVREVQSLTALTSLALEGILMPPPAVAAVVSAPPAAPMPAAAPTAPLAPPLWWVPQPGPGSAAAVAAATAAAMLPFGAAAGIGAETPGAAAATTAAAQAAQPCAWSGYHRWLLPPRLAALTLTMASPTVLASLAAPDCLSRVTTQRFCRGYRIEITQFDLDAYGGGQPRLAATAIGAIPAAVELLRGRADPGDRDSLLVTAMGFSGYSGCGVQPPLSLALGGHACWLVTLAGLQLRKLHLNGLRLDAFDIARLSGALTSLTELELEASPFPAAALPSLTALKGLQRFAFDWLACAGEYSSWGMEEVNVPALSQLALGLPSLQTLAIRKHGGGGVPGLVGALSQVPQLLAASGCRVTIVLE